MTKLTVTTISLALAIAGTRGLYATEKAEVHTKQPPRVEVVFVLDTTGSMGGLIQAAKEKIWAVANTLAGAEPAPEIKMGLIGYRDRGDAYVTKRTALTDDLDKVFAELMAFKANGGGDGPESVNQALHEAVTATAWSKDPDTYRVVFLVGDCPPHMDYPNDVKYPDSCKRAAGAGIVINTIQCGAESATTPIWKEIARRAEGEYFRVEQSGGRVVPVTPFDAKLEELSKSLDATRLFYGSTAEQDEAADRVAKSSEIYKLASPSAKASRAAFNAGEAGAKNFAYEQELVSAFAEGDVKLTELKDDELPKKLKAMSPEKRKAHLAELVATRKTIQADIKTTAAKRQQHLEELVKRNSAKSAPALDQGIYECIQKQAGKKGIVYKGGPAL